MAHCMLIRQASINDCAVMTTSRCDRRRDNMTTKRDSWCCDSCYDNPTAIPMIRTSRATRMMTQRMMNSFFYNIIITHIISITVISSNNFATLFASNMTITWKWSEYHHGTFTADMHWLCNRATKLDKWQHSAMGHRMRFGVSDTVSLN